MIQEALNALRDERRAQCNLLEILSATRYKTLTPEGLKPTKCPLQSCSEQDSFSHMLARYDLARYVELGSATAQFLVQMARKTQILNPDAPRIYNAPTNI